jgi:multicomponent Na+:H+ antiporter subunit E
VSDNRILVPVSDTETVRRTVDHAVSVALEDAETGYVRFVYVHSGELTGDQVLDGADSQEEYEEGERLLDRASVWAEEDAGDREVDLTVETAHVGTDTYLFSPEDVAYALGADATAHEVAHIVLDPEYDPGIGAPFLRPLEYELGRLDEITFEEAPVTRQTRRRPLVIRSTPIQVGVLFGVAFVFYQVLAGTPKPLDLVTGAISATIVAVGLSQITFSKDPGLQSLLRVGRLVIYVPYLFWEITKANVVVAAVILNPRSEIDPRLTRIRPAVWGSLPITTLANSITLTPGTLTVRVDEQELIVHSLIPSARADLFDGGLERATRFAFYGRRAMSIPSPRERGDVEILQPPADGTDPAMESATDEATGGDPSGDERADEGPSGTQEGGDQS